MVIRDWYEREVDLCEYWHVCKTRMSTEEVNLVGVVKRPRIVMILLYAG